MHGRHFTFKSVLGDTAITLVAPTVTGTLVDQEHPYVAHGPWLQVLIPDDLAQLISDSFEDLDNPEEVRRCFEYQTLSCRCYSVKFCMKMILNNINQLIFVM